MTADSSVFISPSEEATSPKSVDAYFQVHLKSEGDRLLLILPKPSPKETPNDWIEIFQGLKPCLKRSEITWVANTPIHLVVYDRLLDTRQLQDIAQSLQEQDLQLKCICTSRRQTAVAAATSGYSVEQQPFTQSLSSESNQKQTLLAEPLYLKTTVRSGVEVRHPGTVIIQGDVNPGGAIIAYGDILIWGYLRGIAHAGAKGNQDSTIMALRMEPTQLRIADVVARAPSISPEQFEPEIAYITSEGIRITQAYNFFKTHTFIKELGVWKAKDEKPADKEEQS